MLSQRRNVSIGQGTSIARSFSKNHVCFNLKLGFFSICAMCKMASLNYRGYRLWRDLLSRDLNQLCRFASLNHNICMLMRPQCLFSELRRPTHFTAVWLSLFEIHVTVLGPGMCRCKCIVTTGIMSLMALHTHSQQLRYLSNADLMLTERLERWPIINPSLCRCLLLSPTQTWSGE